MKLGLWPGFEEVVRTTYRPRKHRQDITLVLNNGWLTPGVLSALEARKMPYFYLDLDELSTAGTIELSSDASRPQWITAGPARLDLRDVAAVVWGVPNVWMTSPWKKGAPELYLARWKQFLRDLRAVIRPQALWFCSHPMNGSQEWQNKWSESLLARQHGLAVPDAICTSDPVAASRFIRQSKGRVLFRELTQLGTLFPIVFVDKTKAQPRDLEKIRSAPCVFQAYVEKEFEVRAVRVGPRVFACRIDSQASQKSAVDWRAYDNANVRWDRIDLPRSVERSLVALGESLDLLYCSFDLIKGKDGLWYFLEVNRPGATYWLLPFVGLDIPAEIVAHIDRTLPTRR